MKSRIALSVPVVLMLLGTVALAQSDTQKSFDKLKTLAGEWEGIVNVPEAPSMSGAKMHVSLHVTSRGNALVHEMQEAGTPLDATKYDHPVTLFYLDADQLTLVHYCDAGNRPRMSGKLSPDGKTLEFNFLDVSGSTQAGHMQHVTFNFIDPDHHSEKWQFAMADGKSMGGLIELKRVQ